MLCSNFQTKVNKIFYLSVMNVILQDWMTESNAALELVHDVTKTVSRTRTSVCHARITCPHALNEAVGLMVDG